MDIAEARTTIGGEAGGRTYAAFLSYSHAADELLAPRLQSGLQRFAKPWWKRRALRIFRDEASLSANPHLWSSITRALDDSGWFVLLLSPDAAASEWVNREVEYWLDRKGPDRIIPVVTDGEFAWVDGNVVSDAAPPALRGAFSDEPRWVDLRFARSEEQLDLKNPRFSAAVADIASAVRGVPKDELESEEVRQHRRTVRTAWAVAAVVTLFAMIAAAAALFALDQRDDAQAAAEAEAEQRLAAEAARAAEELQRITAEVAREAEIVARSLADQEAERANRSAAQMLDYVLQRENSRVEPPGRNYVLADLPPSELTVRHRPPDSTRLDFLYVSCTRGCFRDAAFVHPELPLRTGVTLAYRPFHIRHGFINPEETPLPTGSAFEPPGYDLRVFVTRRAGPELRDGSYPIDQTYRFHVDYLIREDSSRCGPDYATQAEPQPCDLFVHDFPDGLPPGRYDFWVEWHAPCAAWVGAEICPSPTQPVSLFAATVDSPVYHDTFTPNDDPGVGWQFRGATGSPAWPFDPWDHADPLS
jgi:hypothetical protein